MSAQERPYHRRVVAGAVAAARTWWATISGRWDGESHPAAMSVWADCPLIFTAYETTNYVMTPQVYGSTINPPLDLRLGQVWKTT